MPDDIRKHLDELHAHLESVEGSEAADLRGAVAKYRESLEDDDHDDDDFIDGLREAALRYEVSHPELSNFMARLVNTLTAAGF